MSFWDNFTSDRLLAAHRGYRAIRPENTLASFEASAGRCDFVELDVGFSSDGIPIVIHDDTLERTSNAVQLDEFIAPYNVTDYTLKQLKKLDISTWFLTSDPFGMIGNAIDNLKNIPIERVPTLREVLVLLKKLNLPVNVEIKDMSGSSFDSVATETILKVINELDMEAMILLSSFNHSYLKEARDISPHITRAALQEKYHPDSLTDYLQKLGVECYHPEDAIITQELMSELNDAEIVVNVFTVNSKKRQEELYSWGVKSVFSDFCR